MLGGQEWAVIHYILFVTASTFSFFYEFFKPTIV